MSETAEITGSVAFLLAKLGQLATARFAERLAPVGLRPRHCGVLGVLAGPPRSQLELAGILGVTPSVVVEMLDELAALGAVSRVRDAADRRRQLTQLTRRGHALSRQAAKLARDIDGELLAGLPPREAAGLRDTLREMAHQHDLPGGVPRP